MYQIVIRVNFLILFTFPLKIKSVYLHIEKTSQIIKHTITNKIAIAMSVIKFRKFHSKKTTLTFFKNKRCIQYIGRVTLPKPIREAHIRLDL